MCGILALISHRRIDAVALAAASAAVSHRGPDDEGYVLFAEGAEPLVLRGGDLASARAAPDACWHAALAHRRLSIIDLSEGGHQPMCTPDRRCWITYNGELYNYIELREELKSLGFGFASESDTEVILVAYRAWGPRCLERFNGMFAFVLLDLEARRVFAARDRFGVKPLYYWVSPEGQIVLASEIKQFTTLPGWRAVLNGQRAYDFLNWGLFDHSDETLFDGVFQLRGGESATFAVSGVAAHGARLPVSRWYELRPTRFDGSFHEAGEEFRRLLTDSVRLRLRADVPVGSCLSGGLDSSSIVCLANRLLRETGIASSQKTFTAGSTTKEFDERAFAEEVVHATGVDAHYVEPDPDRLFELLGRMTWHQDEPFGSTSVY
ncbi:MAG: asparagine synthase (glutamine-hydrolyzing), partial [Burkholderiales bacterium]